MAGRQVFSLSEKNCLEYLVRKYKIHTSTNVTEKKAAWALLTDDYNSIETNIKRSEAQLKKCWENLKSRRKAAMAKKRGFIRVGRGYHSAPGSFKKDPLLDSEVTLEESDNEMHFNQTNNDAIPLETSQVSLHSERGIIEEDCPPTQSQVKAESEPELDTDNYAQFHGSFYSSNGQQRKGSSNNIKGKVITREFKIRKANYERAQERLEEIHKLLVAEKRWAVRAANEVYHKAKIERQAAEELLRCNQAKREEAELSLEIKRKNVADS